MIFSKSDVLHWKAGPKKDDNAKSGHTPRNARTVATLEILKMGSERSNNSTENSEVRTTYRVLAETERARLSEAQLAGAISEYPRQILDAWAYSRLTRNTVLTQFSGIGSARIKNHPMIWIKTPACIA